MGFALRNIVSAVVCLALVACAGAEPDAADDQLRIRSASRQAVLVSEAITGRDVQAFKLLADPDALASMNAKSQQELDQALLDVIDHQREGWAKTIAVEVAATGLHPFETAEIALSGHTAEIHLRLEGARQQKALFFEEGTDGVFRFLGSQPKEPSAPAARTDALVDRSTWWIHRNNTNKTKGFFFNADMQCYAHPWWWQGAYQEPGLPRETDYGVGNLKPYQETLRLLPCTPVGFGSCLIRPYSDPSQVFNGYVAGICDSPCWNQWIGVDLWHDGERLGCHR